MKTTVLALALVCAIPPVASAHENTSAAGVPGTPSAPARTIDLAIHENPDGTMSYGDPNPIDVPLGEQILFKITNDGKARHEFRLDSAKGNQAHEAMMAEMPGMVHHDANSVTIAPGTMAQVLWRFSKPGTFEYACLIPGHYEAGMHGRVIVAQ